MAACNGKRAYTSEDRAKRANGTANFRIRPYLCDKCSKWHVANADKLPTPPKDPNRWRRALQKSIERPEVTDPAKVAELFDKMKKEQ